MIELLEKYYKELEQEHSEFKNAHKKENPGDCGFHYDKEKCTWLERRKIQNIKEQKLHIKRLMKLIKESEE